MYHLTCPTCRKLTESPFVRTGAVVRCDACQGKYRIKSAYVERVLETGPRTLDEAETLLRTESVDIEPDEVAPVSIDDDGNVVGLSGLSELMRQSDAKGARDKVQAKMEQAPKPPSAVPSAKPSEGVVQLPDASVASGKPSGSANRRARLLSRRRKKRTNAVIVGSLAALLLISGVVLYLVGVGQPGNSADDGQANTTPGTSDGDNAASAGGNTPTQPKPPGNDTNPTPIQPEPELFANVGPPSPNPDADRFVPPWKPAGPDALPEDVSMVLTPARRVEHEGWYVMSPPRGSADAGGDTGVELSELTPQTLAPGETRLVGTVRNTTDRALLTGELHVMLLDSSGRVFAETYMPLVMIGPGKEQRVALAIASRYWDRKRGVRTGVRVQDWGDVLKPMPGVQLDPIGSGQHAALRISARHLGEFALRGVLIKIEALDAADNPVARFMVKDEQTYIAPKAWLDLVVATPLNQNEKPTRWAVSVQPR